MKTSPEGLNLIKKFEGFSAKPYLCPAGKVTIGYGHVILPNEKFPPSGISETEAENILKKDAEIAENAIEELVARPLKQNQFDALASFIFNIGAKKFSSSKLRLFLNNEDYESAAAEFPRWIYAAGKKQNGLIKRRQAEQELFAQTC